MGYGRRNPFFQVKESNNPYRNPVRESHIMVVIPSFRSKNQTVISRDIIEIMTDRRNPFFQVKESNATNYIYKSASVMVVIPSFRSKNQTLSEKDKIQSLSYPS